MERCADPSDQATRIEIEGTEDRISQISRLVPRPEEMLKLHDTCAGCGGDVDPPERRALGYGTCITCAERRDRAARGL